MDITDICDGIQFLVMYKRHFGEPSNDTKYNSYNKCGWYQQYIVQIHNW